MQYVLIILSVTHCTFHNTSRLLLTSKLFLHREFFFFFFLSFFLSFLFYISDSSMLCFYFYFYCLLLLLLLTCSFYLPQLLIILCIVFLDSFECSEGETIFTCHKISMESSITKWLFNGVVTSSEEFDPSLNKIRFHFYIKKN